MTAERVAVLTAALRQQLDADVDAEQVSPGRYRFAVVSPRFEALSHLQRQDQVWEIVDATLGREENLEISLILTFSPQDVGIHAGGDLMGLLEKDKSHPTP